MTLRIFVESKRDGGVVALHGRLSGAEVGEVEKVVAEAGPSSRLDLQHLTGADVEGLCALRQLERSGTLLTGASHYIELLLRSEALEREGNGEQRAREKRG